MSTCIDKVLESCVVALQTVRFFLDGSIRDDEDTNNLSLTFEDIRIKREDLLVALKDCSAQYMTNANLLIAAVEDVNI